MAKKKATGVKKQPMRMCVGCHEMFPKRELLRVVRLANAEEEEDAPAKVAIDKTGKLAGRGAYICARAECFEKAHKTRALERALSTKIADEVFEALKGQLNA